MSIVHELNSSFHRMSNEIIQILDSLKSQVNAGFLDRVYTSKGLECLVKRETTISSRIIGSRACKYFLRNRTKMDIYDITFPLLCNFLYTLDQGSNLGKTLQNSLEEKFEEKEDKRTDYCLMCWYYCKCGKNLT